MRRPSIQTCLLVFLFVLLMGCSVSFTRYAWKVDSAASEMGMPESEFMELANRINEELGLSFREAFESPYLGEIQIRETDSIEESAMPEWLNIRYILDTQTVVLVYSNSFKNQIEVVEAVKLQIEEVISRILGARYEVKVEKNENARGWIY